MAGKRTEMSRRPASPDRVSSPPSGGTGCGKGRLFRAELAGIDAEFFDPVLDDPFGRPEELRRPGLISTYLLEGLHDQLPLLGIDDGAQLAPLFSLPASGADLKGRGRMHRLQRIPPGEDTP